MATRTTAQAGAWSTASTWGGTVPGASDTAVVKHAVTLTASATVGSIRIEGGGITIDPSVSLPDQGIILTAGTVTYTPDGTAVRMDGGRIATRPCISGIYTLTDDGDKVIIDDAGPIGISAAMEDMKPEGYAPAWARRVSNNVRYQTVRVHIRADCLGIVGSLIRMADRPEQVLAVTDSAVIKGHIENLAPVSDTGREYIVYNITIAEGRRWPTRVHR